MVEYLGESLGNSIKDLIGMVVGIYEEKWLFVLLMVFLIVSLLWVITRMFDYH